MNKTFKWPNNWPTALNRCSLQRPAWCLCPTTGVKEGWLDKKTYEPAARKAWLALITYIDEKGDIREVCEGTNKKNDRQYYLDRKRNTGDMHGQAPVLWCATALLR